jgi:hypothetical protein
LRAPFEDTVETASPRSPDQVRGLMSALQRGTTRGRLAAAGVDPGAPIPAQRRPSEPMTGEPGSEERLAERATEILPVVQNRPELQSSEARDRHGVAGARERVEKAETPPDHHEAARPDKDA